MIAVKRNPTAYAPLVPGSPEWQTHRRTLIGASEVPAILGEVGQDTYKSAFDIWLEKTGKAVEEPRDPVSPAAIGNRIERVIADLYRDKHPEVVALERAWTEHDLVLPILAATPDFDVFEAHDEDRAYSLQVKNRGGFPQGWGDDGTSDVPRPVLIQVLTELAVTRKRMGRIAVLLSGNRFAWYEVHADDEVEAFIRDGVDRFWTDHVLADIPPKISGPGAQRFFASKFARATSDTVRLLRADDDVDAVNIPALVEAFEAKQALDNAEQRYEDAKASCMPIIGEFKGIEAVRVGRALWANHRGKEGISKDSLRAALRAALDPGSIVGAGLTVDEQIDSIIAAATKRGDDYRQFTLYKAR